MPQARLTRARPKPAVSAMPLAVDVDGTLIKTDLLQEAALQFVARHPLRAPLLAFWLAQGKAYLKHRLADDVDLDVASIPLREEVVALIRQVQAEGRPVYLASASERRYVEDLAARIGGVAGVFATDGEHNLAGPRKAAALIDAFGEGGFDYVGDTAVDFAVWRSARKVLAVTHSSGFAAKVGRAFPQAEIIARPRPSLAAYGKVMRPHQWAKNTLLFLPLLAGHHFADSTLFATITGFLSFCAAASSAYILNDLLDLPSDRAHARKSRRAFACGEVPIVHGLAMAAFLMAVAFADAATLPARFAVVLGLYVAGTLSYSMLLKRKVMIDVITLGGLYTLRVLAGVEAAATTRSQWLLMFSLFLFLSLALVKRCAELVRQREAGQAGAPGRGYQVSDLSVVFPLASAAGYGAVFVVSLYLNSPEVRALYHHPDLLWLAMPLLLYWVSRLLILTNRDQMHDDPVVWAMTDRISVLTGALVAGVVLASI